MNKTNRLYSFPLWEVWKRSRLWLLLFLCLPLSLHAQPNRLSLEALPSHHALGGQGVSAPFCGMVDGVLTIAGGCNFPNKPAAEGGEKVFYSDVWYLWKGRWYKYRFSLPTATAYGASVAVPNKGMVCLGGTNGKESLTHVYRISKEGVINWPSLPVGVDNGAAAYGNDCIYVVGGQTDGKPQMGVYRLRPGEGAAVLSAQWEHIADLLARLDCNPVPSFRPTDWTSRCMSLADTTLQQGRLPTTHWN